MTGYDNAPVYNVYFSGVSVTSLSTRLKALFMNASPTNLNLRFIKLGAVNI
jgi:hypothetical protein